MKKRILPLLLVFALWLTSGGFSFTRTELAMDTEANRLYQYVTMDTLNADFGYSRAAAEKKYLGNCYMLVGRIYTRTTKGDSITLTGISSNGTFECTVYDRTVRSAVTTYALGTVVALYGKVTVGFFDKEYHLTVDHISLPPTNPRGGDVYYMTDGSCYSTLDGVERSLANGRIRYRIPSEFTEVELSIKEHELGSLEGYQYVLNRLPGSRSSDPESLFVCYFDKKMLKNRADIGNTVETAKAIVRNIEGDVSRSAAKKVDTYYGQKYTYFQGKYNTLLDGKGFRTEYIFVEDDDKGLIVFLYLYRETDRSKNHLSDVMFVTRFLTR